MSVEDLLPTVLVVALPVAIKWAVDLLAEAWPEAPAWAKRLLSLALALVACWTAGVNLYGDGVAGLVLTAVTVAAVASEVVHPLAGAARAIRDAIRGR